MTFGQLPDGTAYRFRFHWARPLAFFWNRYPGVVIGLAVQVGSKVAGVTWGRPGKAIAAGRHRVQ